MTSIKRPGISSLEFDNAVEAFKGYDCFSNIRPELFDEAVRIAIEEGKTLQLVRGRIAQVIWEDEARNGLKDLPDEKKRDVALRIKEEVNKIVEFCWHKRTPAELKLVQSAE